LPSFGHEHHDTEPLSFRVMVLALGFPP
jgi:hypothetical protein